MRFRRLEFSILLLPSLGLTNTFQNVMAMYGKIAALGAFWQDDESANGFLRTILVRMCRAVGWICQFASVYVESHAETVLVSSLT